MFIITSSLAEFIARLIDQGDYPEGKKIVLQLEMLCAGFAVDDKAAWTGARQWNGSSSFFMQQDSILCSMEYFSIVFRLYNIATCFEMHLLA